MDKKIIVITGASRGIGLEVAKKLATPGTKLVLCCKTKKSKKKLEKDFEKYDCDFIVREFDISSDKEVSRIIDEVISIFNKIDVLINNAGIVYTGKVEEFSIDNWDELIDINLKGTFLMTKYSLPYIPFGGVIINVGSNASKIGFPNWSAYCASKFGVLGFTNALREEVRNNGIRVSSVLPGPTNTEIWDDLDGDWNKDRMMSPETVATVISSIVNQPHGANIDEIDIVPSGGKL